MQETIITFKDFSFIYGDDNNAKPALNDISFDLKKGEVLILAGPSGSGKSTLSYVINGLIPFRIKGLMKGKVDILGKNIMDYDFMELSKKIGLVSQNPSDQLVTFTVRDEIAFGLENLSCPKNEIVQKIDDISKLMNIEHLLDRNIDELSGGQKQLVVLSSILVMEPDILILDEPIAFLDQSSETLLMDRLRRFILSERFDMSIIIIEHRLSRVIDFADKLLVLNQDGIIRLFDDPKKILSEMYEDLISCNLRVPWIHGLIQDFKKQSDSKIALNHPVSFSDVIDKLDSLNQSQLKLMKELLYDNELNPIHLQRFAQKDKAILFDDLYIKTQKGEFSITDDKKKDFHHNEVMKDDSKDVLLKIENLHFQYPNTDIKAVNELNLEIYRGDFIGLIGPNGSGKTTLLYVLANLYEPTSGNVYLNGKPLDSYDPVEYARRFGFIFQNPENMIFKRTLRDEVLYGPNNFGILNNISEEYLSKLLSLIGPEDQYKNPFHLSWGQKRRLNLSSIFVYNPDIILLDEPFIGQDQKTIIDLIETLFILNKRGKTIIIASHDYHLLLKYTKRIIELNKDGTLKEYDSKENFFKKKDLGPILLLKAIQERIENGGN